MFENKDFPVEMLKTCS